MAEEGIDGLLGEDNGSAEAEIGAATADGVAIAVAMDTAKTNPDVAEGVLDYLAKQSRLVGLQLLHFDEERRLAIAAAKRKRLADRLRIGMQLFVALVIVAAIAGMGAIFYDALTDRGVKIEAFAVPPHLADQGMTGQVLANMVLDRIAELQRGSFTVRAPNSFANNWGNDIKVEVPETGISIGEISRWIHESVGRSTRVDGEVFYTKTGVAVSVRVGDYPIIETSGAEAELPQLVQDAATRVYAQTQPYRHGFWLMSQGRTDEANAVYRQLYAEGNLADRIWALNGLANAEESPEKYILTERRALALNPHFLLGALNIAANEFVLGHPELARSEIRAALADERGIADDTLSASGRAVLLAGGQEMLYELDCDYQAANKIARTSTESSSVGGGRDFRRVSEAGILIELHDIVGAAELIELIAVPKYRRAEIRLGEFRVVQAVELGDWAGALSELESFNAKYPRDSQIDLQLAHPAIVAEIYARAGRYTEADELIASFASDNYGGWLARGRVAIVRQDYMNGENALVQAISLAPSYAPAYNDWGDLLRAKGDLPGAIAKYSDANRRGPHWADPLKSWGDVLVAQGKLPEALQKYDQALKYAPNWAALKAAREAAAKRKS
jgi:tetratricopeptide (TPR) repeat protein